MLNFAEQTGSGAVIVVWSFLMKYNKLKLIKSKKMHTNKKNTRTGITEA